MRSNRVLGKALALFLAAVTVQVYGQEPPQQAPRPHPSHSAMEHRAQSREAQVASVGAQPTDPNKFQRNMAQAPFEESMRKAVNPCNRDYGTIFNGWQDITVQYTLKSIVWWGGVLALFSRHNHRPRATIAAAR